MKRAWLMAALALLLTVTGGQPASAHPGQDDPTHSGNDTAVDEARHAGLWNTNGCTAVPDSARGVFYFEHACDHHDGCYGGHWKSRLGCDNKFWSNMERSCTYDWDWWNPARGLCRGVRDLYYAGVRAFGAPAYYGWSIDIPLG